MKNKLHQLFISSRPISWVNTAYPFAAGYVMTTHRFDITLIVGTLFFLIPYNIVMYGVNDVFDYESDMRNPRKGGVEGAVLSKVLHPFILGSAAVASVPLFIVLLTLSQGMLGMLTLTFVMATVLAYSVPKLRFKERPLIDSMTSSAHFVGPLAYAFTFTPFTYSYFVILLAFFCWGMASHAFGAVQDIIPDREAGLRSIATRFGASATARLAITLYCLAGLLMLYFKFAGLIVALIAVSYVAMVWPYSNLSDHASQRSNRGWRWFIKLNLLAGFVVSLLLIYIYKFV